MTTYKTKLIDGVEYIKESEAYYYVLDNYMDDLREQILEGEGQYQEDMRNDQDWTTCFMWLPFLYRSTRTNW